MSFECSICLGVHPDIDGYSTIRCGHVFHSTCILQWLGTGKVCPECRVPSSKAAVTRLYLKLASSTQGAASLVESASQETGNWIEKCHTKEMKCQEMQRELDELREVVDKQTADLTTTKESLSLVKQKLATMRVDRENDHENQKMLNIRRRQLEKEREEAKKELERLRSTNQQLTWVKAIMSGSNDDMNEVLSAEPSEGLTRSLGACISALRRELELSKKAAKELQSEVDSWSAKESRLMKEIERRGTLLTNLTAEKSDWEEERTRLVKKMSAMKKMLEAKPGLPQTQIKRFIAESPAPQDLLTSPAISAGSAKLAKDTNERLVLQPAKKPCLPVNSFQTPDASLRRTHSVDMGPLNMGKRAGNRAENQPPLRPKLVKSIFGGGDDTPSPVVKPPVTRDLESPIPTFKSNLQKKGNKRKNLFASKFESENDDEIQIIN